jgi:hypothetical protein
LDWSVRALKEKGPPVKGALDRFGPAATGWI